MLRGDGDAVQYRVTRTQYRKRIDVNLKQLQQFVALAETGNFHRAAERLHMAQPPLSVSMRKLEAELGGALFLRGPQGVALTAAGQAMLADARAALAHAEQCRQAVAAALHGEGGTLRVGFIATATFGLLPRLIPSFRARFPQVDLQLVEASTQSALDGLAEGTLDVGLVRTPVPAHGPFRLTPLEDDELVAAVPAGGPWGARQALALSALAAEPFVMYAPGPVPHLYAVAMLRCQHSGFTPRVAQEAVQVPTILSLVESGLGVALVAGVARRQAHPGVRFLSLTDTPPDFKVGIALATGTRRSGPQRLVEAFTAHAVAVAAGPAGLPGAGPGA